jgi:hypothetical protein
MPFMLRVEVVGDGAAAATGRSGDERNPKPVEHTGESGINVGR